MLRIGRQVEVRAKGFEQPLTLSEVVGIGGPYKLSLMQSRDALVAIAEEIPIECTIIERSRLSQEVFKARVTKLSMKRAVARFQADIPVLSDLEIRIDIQDGQRVPGALYGKVTEVVHDSGV